MRLGEEGMRIAEEIEHATSFTAMCLGFGIFHMRREDLERALPVLERGMEVGRRGSIYVYVFSLAAAVGRVQALTGRIKEGLALMTEVMEDSRARKMALGQAVRLAWLAEGLLVAEEYEPAWERALESLDYSRRLNERGQEAWTLHLLGDIAGRRQPGALDDVERFYRDAMAIAEPLGMRPAVAHCHLGLGRADVRTGRREVCPGTPAQRGQLFRDLGIASLQARAAAARHASRMTRAPLYRWLVPRVVAPLAERCGLPRVDHGASTSRAPVALAGGAGGAGAVPAPATPRSTPPTTFPTIATCSPASMRGTSRPADLARVPIISKAELRAGFPVENHRRESARRAGGSR